jgi:hypothetical protein
VKILAAIYRVFLEIGAGLIRFDLDFARRFREERERNRQRQRDRGSDRDTTRFR